MAISCLLGGKIFCGKGHFLLRENFVETWSYKKERVSINKSEKLIDK